jgi:hypothetical protein
MFEGGMMAERMLAFSDENSLVAEIRKAIGVGPFDPVECVTPQFEREDGRVPPWTPRTAGEFDSLRTLSDEALKFLCLGRWDEHTWLYPGEWYAFIPDGYEIFDINGDTEKFVGGKTDDDIRFGCLPYGFKR